VWRLHLTVCVCRPTSALTTPPPPPPLNTHTHTRPHGAGFREAEAVAKAELASAAFSNVSRPEAFRQDLINIAKTTLSSKILTGAFAWARAGAMRACGGCAWHPCRQRASAPASMHASTSTLCVMCTRKHVRLSPHTTPLCVPDVQRTRTTLRGWLWRPSCG
jgi:hypothetical protein